MKKLILKILAGVVVLIIVALVAIFFSLNSIVKKGVETVGPQLAKVDVQLKRASLSPMSGKGQLTGLVIGNPEGYKTPSAISVGDVKMALEVSSVFSDTVVVDSVNIQAPEVTLEGSLTGGNNLSKILSNLEAATGGGVKTEKTESAESQKKFIVKDLLIQDGKVHLSATALGGKAYTVPLPVVHLQDIGTSEKGVSAAELSKKIMQSLLANVLKAAQENLSAKDLENMGKGTLDKATQGLKDLFK